MPRTIAALLCMLMTLAAGAARAQAPAPHLAITPVVAARHGDTVAIALATRPEAGWHGYWGENPGDAGFPPRFEWRLPSGASVGPWRWPVPTTLLINGLMNFIYDRPYAPVTSVRLPPSAGAAKLGLHLSYLVCTDQLCVPEEQRLEIDLAKPTAPDLAAYEAALPMPLDARAAYAAKDGKVRLSVPYPAGAALNGAYFFPKAMSGIDYAAPQVVTRDGDRLLIATAGHPKGALEGVLRIAPGRGLAVRAAPGAVVGGGEQGWAAALGAFGLAVLGGLILNVMPCVFPILSLKALSLARSGTSAAHARGEALAYAAGVITVLVALGALMLALRAGGASVGWAFQLQSPHVVLLLMLLSAAIGLNLAGLFEVPTPPVGELAGKGGAFATGALAAVIATPCSGPFMGAALGVALVLPWPAALAIFAGLGFGLALPFLAIGFVPFLRTVLPRPGAWMETVRRVLAVPMLMTAIALGWVLGKQTGVDGLTYALAVVLAVAVGLWSAGLRQRRGLAVGAPLSILLVGVTAAATIWLPGKVAAAAPAAEAFSEAKLARLRDEGRPVFAYFTADWCLTCKVNERVAIEPARDALARKHVAVLVGDWTNGDPALGRFIQQHDRAGVPLYLYYAPGQEARVLPQVLTPGVLAGL